MKTKDDFTKEHKQYVARLRNDEAIRDKIEYENYENSVYNAIGTLERKKGNSCDQANLLVSLCRVVGIHARYSYGEGIKFRNGFRKHGWAQILISDF